MKKNPLMRIIILVIFVIICTSCKEEGTLVVKNYTKGSSVLGRCVESPINIYLDGKLIVKFTNTGVDYFEQKLEKGQYIITVQSECNSYIDGKDLWISPGQKTVVEIFDNYTEFNGLYILVNSAY